MQILKVFVALKPVGMKPRRTIDILDSGDDHMPCDESFEGTKCSPYVLNDKEILSGLTDKIKQNN